MDIKKIFHFDEATVFTTLEDMIAKEVASDNIEIDKMYAKAHSLLFEDNQYQLALDMFLDIQKSMSNQKEITISTAYCMIYCYLKLDEVEKSKEILDNAKNILPSSKYNLFVYYYYCLVLDYPNAIKYLDLVYDDKVFNKYKQNNQSDFNYNYFLRKANLLIDAKNEFQIDDRYFYEVFAILKSATRYAKNDETKSETYLLKGFCYLLISDNKSAYECYNTAFSYNPSQRLKDLIEEMRPITTPLTEDEAIKSLENKAKELGIYIKTEIKEIKGNLIQFVIIKQGNPKLEWELTEYQYNLVENPGWENFGGNYIIGENEWV